jgi:hypothetical protein
MFGCASGEYGALIDGKSDIGGGGGLSGISGGGGGGLSDGTALGKLIKYGELVGSVPGGGGGGGLIDGPTSDDTEGTAYGETLGQSIGNSVGYWGGKKNGASVVGWATGEFNTTPFET